MFKFRKLYILAVLLLGLLVACSSEDVSSPQGEDGIKVGILFSLSGPTAISEAGMADAALLAIEEINREGGINGKQIIPIQEDYASDPSQAASKAQKLIMEDKVVAIIGGLTSASRQAMLPIVEEHNSLLIYPTVYEGEEYSENIIYTGAVPNQQLETFIPWLLENVGKRFYLLGNDYVYPVQMNNQLKKLLEIEGGEVVGEEYVPIGHSEFSAILNDIRQAKPDLIFSTLISDSVPPFYTQFADFGFNAQEMPIASPTTNETELSAVANDVAKGHVSSHAYFKTLDTPENKRFVQAFQEKYGEDQPISTIIEAAYYSAYLLAQALEKVEDPYNTDALIEAFVGLEFVAPQGKIKVDENHHIWLTPRIGIVNENGEFDIVHTADEWIQPEPWSKLLFPDHEEPWKK